MGEKEDMELLCMVLSMYRARIFFRIWLTEEWMRLTTKRCHTLHFQWQANVRVSSHFHLAPVSPM